MPQTIVVTEPIVGGSSGVWGQLVNQAFNTIVAGANAHFADAQNPHATTKAQVGLGNVDNTSDINKPISALTAVALAAIIAGEAAAAPVQTVSGRIGNVVVNKTDVGLANADNTSDVNKPVSTAQATADTASVAAAGAAAAGLYGQLPAAADKIVFVTVRGNDANDGLTLKTALATIGAGVTKLGGPGIVQFGMGAISFGTGVDMTASNGVFFRGFGGGYGSGAPATQLVYTGSGAYALNASSSNGFEMQDMMLLYTNASFTGRLLDLRNSNGSDATFALLQDCYLGGLNTVRTAQCLVDLSKSHSIRFLRCNFQNAVIGIRGRGVVGDYANNIDVDSCYFVNNTTAHVSNPGDGWVIKNPTFEALVGGKAGAVICDAGILTNSFTVLGGWAGDVLTGQGGIQYDLSGNNINLHTFIGGNVGSTGVKIRNSATGVFINSRFDSPTNGIDVAGVTLTGYDFSGSSYNAVTNKITTGVAASSLVTNTQTFTTTGTWTLPTNAVMVHIRLWAGGGGGGSGARRASGTLSTGGGSGGSAGYTDRWFPASALLTTMAVTVGAGGVGGAAVTTDNTNGNAGSAGGGSGFGATSSYSMFTTAGQPGGGGSSTTFGAAGASAPGGTNNGANGVQSSATGLLGQDGQGGPITLSGGSGGGITTGVVASAGGLGAGPGTGGGGGAAGTSGGGVGGTPPTSFGGGGGGGGSSTTTAAGAGGAGAASGGGGGGGGASLNGFASGAGGAGGPGLVIVDTFF